MVHTKTIRRRGSGSNCILERDGAQENRGASRANGEFRLPLGGEGQGEGVRRSFVPGPHTEQSSRPGGFKALRFLTIHWGRDRRSLGNNSVAQPSPADYRNLQCLLLIETTCVRSGRGEFRPYRSC